MVHQCQIKGCLSDILCLCYDAGDVGDIAGLYYVVPPETPTQFVTLSNSTSLALTLKWQPGLSGSHPPQVFSIRYMAATKPDLVYERTLPGDGSKEQYLTIDGLAPETLYKFRLSAHSNNADVIRSGLATAEGKTTGRISTILILNSGLCIVYVKNGRLLHRYSAILTIITIHYGLEAERRLLTSPKSSRSFTAGLH